MDMVRFELFLTIKVVRNNNLTGVTLNSKQGLSGISGFTVSMFKTMRRLQVVRSISLPLNKLQDQFHDKHFAI